MIKLNKKVGYAIIAILHLSRQDKELLVNAREIAEIYNIPAELLGKVMQKMVKAGLIESVQGANGGYYLNIPLEQLSLLTLIDKIEGSFGITNCIMHNANNCSCKQIDVCTIKNALSDVQKEINEFFNSITLDKFISKKKPVIKI